MDSTKFSIQVSKNVDEAIRAAGFSILAMSQKTGIPRTTLLRHIEHPETSPFNVLELNQIAAITEQTVVDLMKISEKSALAEGGE